MLEQVVRWGDAMETEPHVPEDACWAFRRDQPHLVPPDEESLRCPHQAHTGPQGSLCLPMGAKGALIGILHIKLGAASVQAEDKSAMRSMDDTMRLAGSISEHVALTLTNMQLRDELRAQSIRDPLTELYNRRYMEETFDREWHRAQRQRQTLAVILFDVDHFKQVNDSRGHEAGDLVLAGLGRLLRDLVRQEDVPCRYGGEEFIVIMPGADLASAEERAERLRAAVEQLTLTYQGEPLHVTISLGVVAFPVHGHAPDTLIHAADAALYAAKHAGRNCVRTPPASRPSGAASLEQP
jgi:diguanylate cyclase (GGDEF)-like protein